MNSAAEISNAQTTDSANESRQRSANWPVSLLVFGSLLTYSAVQTPVPGANEPHYLCKARHYWDADYCPGGDFFLDSSNTHLVFYQTIGIFTRWLTLEQTAWIGRILAYGLLAIGWTLFLRQVLPGEWSPLWAIWIFLAITRLGDVPRLMNWSEATGIKSLDRYVLTLSGEWLVGGLEAKVFSYAFVFWAMSEWMQGRQNRAAIFAGLAVSFHPIVGIWALIAGGIAELVFRWPSISAAWKQRQVFAAMKTHWLAGLLLVGFSFPGVIPALNVVGGADSEVVRQANEIQVFSRLAHHLDPYRFREGIWLIYGIMLIVWLILRRFLPTSRNEHWLFLFVLGTLLIALGGWIVGRVPRLENGLPDSDSFLFSLRMSLMKFYPFRLCDVFAPIALSVALAGCFARISANRMGVNAIRWAGLACVYLFALWSPSLDRDPSRMNEQTFADWKDACRWISEKTPANSLVYTANSSPWAFKWYAERAEYFSYKDCPQDPEGILEWRRRDQILQDWVESYAEIPTYTKASLRELHEKTGITHLICEADIVFDIAPVYVSPQTEKGENQPKTGFAVYELKSAYENP
ncbi:MAG: hypothetical protein Tsb009_16750 [Planctomycetaceae bacterium]